MAITHLSDTAHAVMAITEREHADISRREREHEGDGSIGCVYEEVRIRGLLSQCIRSESERPTIPVIPRSNPTCREVKGHWDRANKGAVSR